MKSPIKYDSSHGGKYGDIGFCVTQWYRRFGKTHCLHLQSLPSFCMLLCVHLYNWTNNCREISTQVRKWQKKFWVWIWTLKQWYALQSLHGLHILRLALGHKSLFSVLLSQRIHWGVCSIVNNSYHCPTQNYQFTIQISLIHNCSISSC